MKKEWFIHTSGSYLKISVLVSDKAHLGPDLKCSCIASQFATQNVLTVIHLEKLRLRFLSPKSNNYVE